MTKSTVTDKRMIGLMVLYEMHTGFFHKSLEGLTEAAAHDRLGTKANHISWIAGSLLNQRYFIAGLLGKEMQSGSHEFFKDNKGIQENLTYPKLDSYKKDWDAISPILENLLSAADVDQLDAPFKGMPGMEMSHFELISFMIYREATCIGQIALLRRQLGFEALKYD